jgi:hypothetical protein
MMRRGYNPPMRPSCAFLLLVLCGCGSLPKLPPRPDFSSHPGIRDSADKLQTYYNYRLSPGEGGYTYGKLTIARWQLAPFLDHQGDTLAAGWARQGNWWVAGGWTTAFALEGAAVAIGAQAAAGDPARNAWWVGLLPAALLGWTFHWIGDGWFRKPAVAHYDLQLKRELGITPD